MRILNPKYVKRAGMWAVTIFNGDKQDIKWFGTEAEAWDFVREMKK